MGTADRSQVSRSPSASQSPGLLGGIRVVDLTSVVLGPYATQMLGDMGADVIKVEGPDGDIMRYAEPARSRGMGAVFLNVNRNKRAVCLDLKRPEALQAVMRLVGTADVFVHSMRPQAIGKLGLSYEAVARVRPDIVYCSTWGFGSNGPYGEQPAYDDVIQAMSGLADLYARRSGGAPELVPSIVADKVAGLTAYGAILTALFHRQRTGEGQNVEVPMYETLTGFNLVEHLAGAVFEPPIGPMGYRRALAAERRPYRTADGYVSVLPYSTRHWTAFFEAAGRPDLARDERVHDAGLRSRSIEALYALIAQIMPERTTAEWISRLRDADVPCVAVPTLEAVRDDPHLAQVAFFHEYEHPTEGPVRTTRPAVRYERAPDWSVRHAPPRIGEHTRAILAELGLTDDEVAALLASGAAIAAE